MNGVIALNWCLDTTETRLAVLGLGFFVAGVALALSAVCRRLMRRKAPKKPSLRRWWDVFVTVLLFITSVVFVMWLRSHEWARFTQMAALAAALSVYHDHEGSLPDNLEAVTATGLVGLQSCKPIGDGYVDIKGACVRYMKATEPGFVVAVEGRSWWPRGYVILGDTSFHRVGETGLQEILADDDQRRKAAGQPHGWSNMTWED